ncbi:MAG: hypothetical protein ABI237_11270 [Ginsengibacter sp.]
MKTDDPFSIPDEIISVSGSMEETSVKEVRAQLIALINELINKDFHALVQLLYRIDVDERKIKHCLDQQREEDSSPVIADLIIERQLQKIESRKFFSRGRDKSRESDEEKW